MKILLITLVLTSGSAFAYTDIPSELLCAKVDGYKELSISCVSKISMERDALEVKKLKMEIAALERAEAEQTQKVNVKLSTPKKK